MYNICFYSYDPELYVNADAHVFLTEINTIENDIEYIVSQIEDNSIDVTAEYDNWIKVAFALIDALGESSRAFFHRISRLNNGYDISSCNKQFDECLKSRKKGITIASLFALARDFGIV